MIKYRGAIIEPGDFGYYQWSHDKYFDVDFDGDHLVSSGCGIGKTVRECKEAIDQLLELEEAL